jgi:hypothetical protein
VNGDKYFPVSPQFRLATGSVPGLSLSASGVLGGTPTTSGTFPLTVHVVDAEGLTASKSYELTVLADVTPPVVTPTITGLYGSDGWYRSDVGVSWSVVDDESAVSVQIGCEEKSVTTDTAGMTSACQATSSGGTTSKSLTIKRDATRPVLAPKVSPNPVALNGTAIATPGASDATSGLEAAGCASVDTSSAGSFSVACTARDKAGNLATAYASYVVTDAEPSSSIRFVKPEAGTAYNAGGAFRAKFRILDASGRRISDAQAQALVAACRVKAGLDKAARCARYRAGMHIFVSKVLVRQGTSPGPHQVVVEVRAPDGTLTDSAERAVTVR